LLQREDPTTKKRRRHRKKCHSIPSFYPARRPTRGGGGGTLRPGHYATPTEIAPRGKKKKKAGSPTLPDQKEHGRSRRQVLAGKTEAAGGKKKNAPSGRSLSPTWRPSRERKDRPTRTTSSRQRETIPTPRRDPGRTASLRGKRYFVPSPEKCSTRKVLFRTTSWEGEKDPGRGGESGRWFGVSIVFKEERHRLRRLQRQTLTGPGLGAEEGRVSIYGFKTELSPLITRMGKGVYLLRSTKGAGLDWTSGGETGDT